VGSELLSIVWAVCLRTQGLGRSKRSDLIILRMLLAATFDNRYSSKPDEDRVVTVEPQLQRAQAWLERQGARWRLGGRILP